MLSPSSAHSREIGPPGLKLGDVIVSEPLAIVLLGRVCTDLSM
jgi:hypothetical protein